MKVLKVENPLTEEQTKQIEEYFKEEISCECGVSFETDVRDYELEVAMLKKDDTCIVTTTVSCPSCGKVYSREFVCKDENVDNINIYRTHLNAMELI